ncbi:MAG: prenyltransferase [Bacteroidota bacterium]
MVKMWVKALRVIPRITKEEWNQLDFISKWLISTRAAVFIMTASAGVIGGLLAYRSGEFNWVVFLLAVFGLVMAHATNNLLNDYTDFTRGVDHNNYFRAQYGPHPLEHGLLSKKAYIRYILGTGLIALTVGILITLMTGYATLWLVAAGLFFLLFYTWPLKYIGLGEISVVAVWGPLMVGGTYFVVTGGHWDHSVTLISLVYALGPTTVLLGKHTDKLFQDKVKKVRTLPVIIGEKASRYLTISLWVLQYALILWLVISKFSSPALLIIFLSVPKFIKTAKIFLKPRPTEPPAGYDPSGWPLYLVAYAFIFTRSFGLWFLLGVIGDVVINKLF